MNELVSRNTELRDHTASGLSRSDDVAKSDGLISGSLLAHAVILYARATETEPIDRWRWFNRRLLSNDQRTWHDEVMRYRDKALAHFGLDPDLEDGPAIAHALVLRNVTAGRPPAISYVENRANTRGRFTDRLFSLVHHLVPLAHERFDKRIDEVWSAFRASVISDTNISEHIKRSRFDIAILGAGPMPLFDDEDSRELSQHYILHRPAPNDRSDRRS